MKNYLETLPAGTYYIGDPCYIFEKSWMELLNATDYLSDGLFTFRGFTGFASNTMYGDGLYHGSPMGRIPVDAGLIGCLPVEMLEIDQKVTAEEIVADEIGIIVTFEKPFVVDRDDDGTFQFGNIHIATGDDECGYEDDEDDNQEDD